MQCIKRIKMKWPEGVGTNMEGITRVDPEAPGTGTQLGGYGAGYRRELRGLAWYPYPKRAVSTRSAGSGWGGVCVWHTHGSLSFPPPLTHTHTHTHTLAHSLTRSRSPHPLPSVTPHALSSMTRTFSCVCNTKGAPLFDTTPRERFC